MKLNAIKQMEHLARLKPGAVSLSQGIPFRDSDAEIRTDVIEAINRGVADKYSDPQGIVELRNTIAQELQREDMTYAPSDVIVTAGAIEALSSVFLTFLTPDRNEVIVPTPTYSAYFKAINVAKGISVPIQLHEESQWQLDIAEVEQAITPKTRMILLCNPNNPTGNVYDQATLEALCELAVKRNILIILDEVYKNMIFNHDSWYEPCANPRYRKNIVRIVSFSKDFALSGWRVGFLHTDHSLIEQILPVHDALVNCTPVISQYAAISALKHAERIYQENTAIYGRNRDIMAQYLDEAGLSYDKPQGGYFFFVKMPEGVNVDQFCIDLFQNESVTVVPGSDFGMGGQQFIRLCFGRSQKDIHQGMQGFVREVQRQTAHARANDGKIDSFMKLV